jgi:hypothetical protein
MDNKNIQNWIRANLIFINKYTLKKINYKIITYENLNDINKIPDFILEILNNWLSQIRYKKIDTETYKKIKLLNIMNEFSLTHKLKQYSNCIHIKDIKKYSYNFFDDNYPLILDKIPYENEWYDIDYFINEKNNLLI